MNMVNIIMTSYNGEKYIKEQIESIQNSHYKNWNLWIFDDGSTDSTRQIVDAFERQDSNRIHFIINDKNKGVTRNFLEGITFLKREFYNYTESNEGSKHDYFMFCDQDDVWMPDKIEKTLKFIKKAEKTHGSDTVLAVFTDALVVDSKLVPINQSFYKSSKLNINNVDLPHLLMENKMIGCTIMFNFALFDKINKLPEVVRYHDWWIALIAAAFGHISFLPEPTLYYRQHGNNVVGNQNFLSYVKNRVSSLRKQKEILESTIIQGREFYRIYQKELTLPKKRQVSVFANLGQESWLKKRYLVLKYGYTKTGFVRNTGLLLLI
jgi:glycosyltransferase involved in cell wall biosynthesis